MSTVFTFSNTTNSVPEIFTFISNVFCGCDKKKKIQRYIKLKFKYRRTFIHVAVSKVLMFCDFPQFYYGWVIQEEYSFLIFKNLQFTTCSTLMTMNNWARGASIVALRGPQCISTHLTVKCYPLSSFESRRAGYESVYYGINNTRPG